MMDKRKTTNNLDGRIWTPDEDVQLVECVLRNVRMGNSVIDGCREFEEATGGERSIDSSKFRFHTKLKAQYAAGYEVARTEGKKVRDSKRRKINRGERMEQIMEDIFKDHDRPIVIDDIVAMLGVYKKQVEEQNLDGKYEEEILKLRREKERLSKENKKLKDELKENKKEMKVLTKEFKDLKNALLVLQNLKVVPKEGKEYKINKDGTVESV